MRGADQRHFAMGKTGGARGAGPDWLGPRDEGAAQQQEPRAERRKKRKDGDDDEEEDSKGKKKGGIKARRY